MNSDILRLIAVAQGIASMLGVIALGIATGNKWGPWLAIASLATAYLATTLLLEAEAFGPKIGNAFALAAIIFGFLSILVVL